VLLDIMGRSIATELDLSSVLFQKRKVASVVLASAANSQATSNYVSVC
jgi:hypothetical protein